ncbi:MAG: metallophosphoesterase [Actinomycetaceae bacterium]|nr:metallophosphoesterase [Actinomycetaceae bacterium]
MLTRTLACLIASGLGALGWALIERRLPRVVEVEIPVLASGHLTVLQVADSHMLRTQDWLETFTQSLDQLDPDLVVCTGDNLGERGALPTFLRSLGGLAKRPGVFTFGSNDYYSPVPKNPLIYFGGPSIAKQRTVRDLPYKKMAQELRERGWTEARNQSALMKIPMKPSKYGAGKQATVAVIGVDDPHINRDRMPAVPEGWDQADLRLGVTHAPYRRVLQKFADLRCDLVICGHTHGGQVRVPFFGALVTNTDLPRQWADGLHRWFESQTYVYISRGLGASKYAPIRFFCRPEANLLRLVPKQ